jgi:hypothetical protein
MRLIKALRLLMLTTALLATGSAIASIDTACGTTEWNLTAGQYIDVGSVTVNNDTENLYVKYKLDAPGAVLGTVHLWVGNTDPTTVSTSNTFPTTPKGTPIPGKFPYSYNVAGGTEYAFAIPLTSLSIADVKSACPLALYVVAHAEVNIDADHDGSYEQQQTAFGGDNPINVVEPGRWWYYGGYNVCCDIPPPPVISQCETAFAKGGYVFTTDKKSNPEKLPSLNLTKNRWGWAINMLSPGAGSYSIYAGAGLNDVSKGTKVGTLSVGWDGSNATVTYSLSGAVMKEVHIYASDTKPTTLAPGQYGYTQYFDPAVTGHSVTFNVTDTNGDGIWLIAHAVSCK